MIEKLKALEATLFTLRQRYHQHLEELTALKDDPTSAVALHDYNELKKQLDDSKAQNIQLQQDNDTLQQKLIDLDERYQRLAEAHHIIGEEQEKLQQQVDELTQLNEALQGKNRLAAEHTKLALKQLSRIDQPAS